jgi:hypothetical protein
MERGMVNANPALCHNLFKIAQAQGIDQIPAYALRDNIGRIMQAQQELSECHN